MGFTTQLRKKNSLGRFPPLDKLDLIENGRLLFGKDIRNILSKPTKKELIISGAEFALSKLRGSEVMKEINQPKLIYNKGTRHSTKIVLFPVRLLYTAITGNIGQNENAINYYANGYNDHTTDLVINAFYWRYEKLIEKIIVINLLEKSLIDLYMRFIDIYYEKMTKYEENTLSTSFLLWKNELMGLFKNTILI